MRLGVIYTSLKKKRRGIAILLGFAPSKDIPASRSTKKFSGKRNKIEKA